MEILVSAVNLCTANLKKAVKMFLNMTAERFGSPASASFNSSVGFGEEGTWKRAATLSRWSPAVELTVRKSLRIKKNCKYLWRIKRRDFLFKDVLPPHRLISCIKSIMKVMMVVSSLLTGVSDYVLVSFVQKHFGLQHFWLPGCSESPLFKWWVIKK